ncbi:MAG: four helix bundle protein [Kiritimatiellae bacterium]|nr:four helix bundle protein [Kiritimatiellia bacterium]
MNEHPDSPAFKSPISHYWLDSWILAALLEHSVREFCLRHLTRQIDPCGRLFDQMTMAARSAAANIAEGNARRSTSRETQMRLLDVARATLVELSGDLRSFLLLAGEAPWSDKEPDAHAVFSMRLDPPAYQSDFDHNVSLHLLAQRAKFAPWLDAEDPLVPARALMVLIARLQRMLGKQLERAHAEFLEKGGFAEALTAGRLAARAAAAAEDGAPACPLCGKPMQRRVAKRGVRAGKPFWSCPDYPACTGTRNAD